MSAGDAPTHHGADALSVDVRRGQPTDDELAALVAVVSEAYSSEAAHAVAADGRGQSAWQLSQRSLRSPVRRDLGWGGFGG